MSATTAQPVKTLDDISGEDDVFAIIAMVKVYKMPLRPASNPTIVMNHRRMR